MADKRLNEVKLEEEQTLNKNNTMYNSMIKDSEDYYKAQIDASKDYVDKQTQLQQEQTDFAIEKLEQQKEQANKDYLKEQSGSYVDWQKESNRYGANAETMASNGFVSSGYGESAQVSMFNTYQNRVATAREVYNKAVLEYDNAMKDARLQNSVALAEIAFNGLQKQLELALQGMQYKNQLIEQQANKQLEIKNMYHQQYQDVLDQINTEKALAEQIRQYNESMAFQREQFAEEKRQYNEQMALQKSRSSGSGSSGGSSRSSSRSSGSSKSSSSSSGYSSGGSSKKNSAASTYSGNRGQGGSAQSSAKASKNNYDKPVYRVTKNMGNSTATMKKSDYYFSNGYQPRYIDNVRLKSTGKTVADLGKNYGVPGSQTVWVANGRCYVWDGKTREYMYVCKA